ncbi:MAG: glycoside hydrolase family 3 N-terminal domain-containing protein [Pseudomonadota bacterium]
MTLAEKIGQMIQTNAPGGIPDDLRGEIEAGRVGSMLNVVDAELANRLQRLAMEESRLGIPLLLARDVIHGFETVLPIPLGLAATWNPELVEQGTRVSALEAARTGINWTFAPMIDISRDARWGRIAESFGEDPYLTGRFAVAMVRGFQGEDLAQPGSIAATAKHFVGYGASEAGRDYNTTNIPENELRNVHLPPFHATVKAGVATLMTSFSDLNGVPASGNELILQQILRDEWGFPGFVVSDWASVAQLVDHGLAADNAEAAVQAANAGVNMEMVSRAYADHLAEAVRQGAVSEARIDELVAQILRVKFQLGLFDNPYTDPAAFPKPGNPDHLAVARQAALESLVLLQNRAAALPLSADEVKSLAVIGPLADDPYEQLGTWIFDGKVELSQTPLSAIRSLIGEAAEIRYVKALETTRTLTDNFAEAVAAASRSDVAVVFVGEESILSGEAHSRANIDLPGSQVELLKALGETGKPVVAVILAGRPLTVQNILDHVDALVFAWHPGSMGGPAIADVLFGVEAPSGKLPATFPKMVGQLPIYYAQKNTGKPATPETYVHFDDLPVRGAQAAFGMTSHHLDAGYTPLYPFGFGLSYTEFRYGNIRRSAETFSSGEVLSLQADVTNSGTVEAVEVVQLYVRDLAGNVTRPVRELKGFQRLRLKPGETRTVTFEITPQDLSFYNRRMQRITEPGDFHAWIGGSSTARLKTEFAFSEEISP